MSEKPSVQKLAQRAEDAKISELPVEAFMKPSVLNIVAGTKIYSAIQALSNFGVSGAPVVDGAQRLIGMISEYDLLMQAATRDIAEEISYKKETVSVDPKTTLAEVLILFYKKRYRRIPVVNKTNRVLGIVSRIDVLNRLIKDASQRTIKVPPSRHLK